MNAELIIPISVLLSGLWTILLVLITMIQALYKWIDDDDTVVYNILIKYFMYKLGFVTASCSSGFIYRNPDTVEDALGACIWGYGIVLIFSILSTVYLISNATLLTWVVVGSISLCYLTRFVVRLSKKVNKMEHR